MPQTVKQYILENIDKTVRCNPVGEGTLIGLPRPYNVPSIADHFQEMYYWDTYFLNRGLILAGRAEQAQNNAENMVYLIEKYGFMPNGNRTFYLHNTQPPFLYMMVADIFDATGDADFLKKAYTVLEKEYAFWQAERNTPTGLAQYRGNTKMATDEGMFRGFLDRIGARPAGHTDAHLSCQYVAQCESGWDISPRFGFHVEDFVEVDLNSLLFALETNMARFAAVLQKPDAAVWQQRVDARRARMNDLMQKDGVLYDYDFKNGRVSDLLTCASFYPMLVGLLTDEQAAATAATLPRLETPYGVAVSDGADYRGDYRYQWQYPNGWAPLHDIVARGLLRYGFQQEAVRVAKKYVALVDRNFAAHGNLWEKYNVVTGAIDVAQEHESMPPMMGWTAGVYLDLSALAQNNA